MKTMKNIRLAAFVFATLLSLNVFARASVPVINLDAIAVNTGSGKKPGAEQVKQAIQAGAGARAWTVAPVGDGKLMATLNVRNKHTIVVDIAYDADKYSVRYKDSINMNFSASGGAPVIHPYYNKWVEELTSQIRIETLKL